MITAILYMVLFILCIGVAVMTIAALVAWKWKAFFSILLMATVAACAYWSPLAVNQWKFSALHQKERWRIIYSPDLSPNPLTELRFLRSDAIVLAEKNLSFRNPSLSPDGQRIAFSLSGGSAPLSSGIGITHVNGRGFERLALPGLKSEGISWSPDGRKLAFWAGRNADTESMDLYLYDFNEMKARCLLKKATSYGTHYTLSWSPDSERLVFASLDGYVSVMNLRSGSVRKIIRGDAPSWSPDGTTIMYREGVPYSKMVNERLMYYAVDPEGKGRRFIFDGGSEKWDTGEVTQPVVWSPDGNYILYFKTYDPFFDTNCSKVYIMDVHQNKKYLVTKNKHIQGCSWGQRKESGSGDL